MAKSDVTNLLSQLRDDMGGTTSSKVEFSNTGIDIYDVFSAGGIPHGNFIEFVGDPGCGKTTLFLQILGGLYKQDPNNTIIVIIDAEKTMTDERLMSFGLDPKKIILVQQGITVEKIFMEKIANLIKHIQDNKLFVPGDPKRKTRTFILWDSIAHTPSEKEKEVSDLNSSIGVKAKVLGHVLRTFDEDLMNCNISILAVNQLSDKVDMGGPYAPKTVNLKGLGGRSVPGGKAQYFAAFHFLVIERANDLSGAEFGFDGYIAKCKFIKNKQGVPFLEFKLVMNYHSGCDNFWTKYMHLVDAKAFKVAGGWYSLIGYKADGEDKEKRFRGSAVKKMYESDDKFKALFDSHWDLYVQELNKRIINAAATASPDTKIEDVSLDKK